MEARNDEKWRQEYMKFSEMLNEKKEEERQILNQLIICLANDGRNEDIIKAAQNPEYQDELIAYYGLDKEEKKAEA